LKRLVKRIAKPETPQPQATLLSSSISVDEHPTIEVNSTQTIEEGRFYSEDAIALGEKAAATTG
jgi:hypothetical protein